MKTYGLLGRNISYSFSAKYFTGKFQQEKIPAIYLNFDIEDLDQLGNILKETPNLSGMNVTIPYKELIIPYLHELDPVAREIGAVNTIKIENAGKLIGYNTDHYGFVNSIKPLLNPGHSHALILGTGGASKAVAYGLKELGIEFRFVSRNSQQGHLKYEDLGAKEFSKYTIIINCTPLGTYPEITASPPIPIMHLSPRHVVMDLIYNPPVTKLLQLSEQQGAKVINGYRMLELQAQKSWEIWNNG